MAIGNIENESQLSAFVAGRLDGWLARVTATHPIKVVGHAVTDGDFAKAPPNGTPAVDSANLRLYVRVADTWRYAGLT